MKTDYKKLLPHMYVVLFFIAICAVYFNPVLQGKGLSQHDTEQWEGLAKEIADQPQAVADTLEMQDDLTDSVKWAIAQGIADQALFGGAVHLFNTETAEPGANHGIYRCSCRGRALKRAAGVTADIL